MGFAALLGSLMAVAPCEDRLRLGETLANGRTDRTWAPVEAA
ncbi:hypothetical protein [Paenibacillus oralis]|nr:hypothetical protein [Paenibacillus oralis]